MCNEIKADRIAHLYALVIVQLWAKVLIKFVMPSRFYRNTMRRMTKVAQMLLHTIHSKIYCESSKPPAVLQ